RFGPHRDAGLGGDRRRRILADVHRASPGRPPPPPRRPAADPRTRPAGRCGRDRSRPRRRRRDLGRRPRDRTRPPSPDGHRDGCGVLTAGLIAQGMTPYDAARLAVFMNGAAGDLAFEEKSYGLTSVDVANNLGRVLAKFL